MDGLAAQLSRPLARPFRAQQNRDLADSDAEADVVEHEVAAEPLAVAVEDDGLLPRRRDRVRLLACDVLGTDIRPAVAHRVTPAGDPWQWTDKRGCRGVRLAVRMTSEEPTFYVLDRLSFEF